MKQHLYDERKLLLRIADGEEGAFKIIYDRYYSKVYTQAVRLLRSEVLGEELLQEVFLKLWRVRDGLTEINNLDAYLKTVTRNLCISALRRLALENRYSKSIAEDYDEAHNTTEETIILKDTRKLINEAIAQLPKQQQEVYRLCHIEGLKYEQAAQQLKISSLTVQTHMKRALRNLRNYLRDHHELTVILIIFKMI